MAKFLFSKGKFLLPGRIQVKILEKVPFKQWSRIFLQCNLKMDIDEYIYILFIHINIFVNG
jgi:hypothetical protein